MKATNAGIMREKNKRLILNLILKNEYSRADISAKTGLTKGAVTIITEEMICDGIITETKAEETGTVGRRPLILKLNPKAMTAVGINITRSFAEIGVVDICGNIICEERLGVFPKDEALLNIRRTAKRMTAECGIPAERIYGIGVTAPGPLDSAKKEILAPTDFDGWHGVNLGTALEGAVCVEGEVYLENIAGGLALYEKYYGVAKHCDNFLALIVDDGIGAGIMTDGRLVRRISELGHTSIAYNGRPCKCGNFGCVERYASIPSILEGTGYSSWCEVIDRDDTALIEKEAEYLACAIVNAANLFSVESVILEGGINYRPEKLIRLIGEKIGRNRIVRRTPTLLSGSEYRGAVCAAVSVFDNYFG